MLEIKKPVSAAGHDEILYLHLNFMAQVTLFARL